MTRDDQADTEQLSRCSRLEADLKEWKRSLPQNFKLDRIGPKDSSYRTVFHLYLNYYYSWITMGKVSLVTVVRSRLRQHLHPEHDAPQVCDTVKRLSEFCTKAARKLLQLFEDLLPPDLAPSMKFDNNVASVEHSNSEAEQADYYSNFRIQFGLILFRLDSRKINPTYANFDGRCSKHFQSIPLSTTVNVSYSTSSVP